MRREEHVVGGELLFEGEQVAIFRERRSRGKKCRNSENKKISNLRFQENNGRSKKRWTGNRDGLYLVILLKFRKKVCPARKKSGKMEMRSFLLGKEKRKTQQLGIKR